MIVGIDGDDQRSAQFWELVRAERDRAIGLAYQLTGDREAAKDIAQEAFLRAFRALPRFRGDCRLSTWLFRIVLNQSRTYHRGRLRNRWLNFGRGSRPPLDPDDRPGYEPWPDSTAGDRELRGRIATALDTLSSRQRAAFSLVHLQGMTVAEAAEVLEIAEGSVKIHLHRALVRLRGELSDYREAAR